MNLGEAKKRVIKLIREYSNKGIEISTTENADYLMSMNDLFDISQKEIATSNKMIVKKVRFIQREYDGLEIDAGTHVSDDIVYECSGAKSFYVELQGYCHVVFEEYNGAAWVELLTIEGDYYGESFKGNLEPTFEDVRVRFTGGFIYDFKYLRLYLNAFPSEDAIPSGGPYSYHALPSNYYMLKEVLLDGEPFGRYQRNTDGSYKDIIFPTDEQGLYEIQYFAYPSTIDSSTGDDYQFEVSDDAVQCMIYYVAYMSKLDEDAFFASEMKETYYMKLNMLQEDHSEGISGIINTSGW